MTKAPTKRRTEEPQTVLVKVSPDKLKAELIFPAGIGRDDVTLEECISALSAAGVIVSPQVTKTVMRMYDALPSQTDARDSTTHEVVACAQLPVPGKDGELKWVVHCAQDVKPNDKERVNHYERSAFIFVEPNQLLARIIEPTTGTEGKDVTGAPLAPTPGKPAHLELDDTTEIKDGQLLARKSGMLWRKGDAVSVHEVMELNSDIDFGTGNIDFKGNIRINGNVLDLFSVKATGDIEIHGLIESAKIDAGGNLTVHGGMTGWPNGELRVGGDCEVRFMDRVRGEISGTLRVNNEILNCNLNVGGAVELTHGEIIGGELLFKGHLTAHVVGSGAGVTTVLIPEMGPDMSITVTQKIHPGTVIQLGTQELYFHHAVSGPIEIAISEVGRLLYRGSDQRARLINLLRGAKLKDR